MVARLNFTMELVAHIDLEDYEDEHPDATVSRIRTIINAGLHRSKYTGECTSVEIGGDEILI